MAVSDFGDALDEKLQITAEKLKAVERTTERLVKQTEAVFKVLPDTIPIFDHFAPTAWLIRNSKILDGKSPGVALSLDRAEKIFITYNQML